MSINRGDNAHRLPLRFSAGAYRRRSITVPARGTRAGGSSARETEGVIEAGHLKPLAANAPAASSSDIEILSASQYAVLFLFLDGESVTVDIPHKARACGGTRGIVAAACARVARQAGVSLERSMAKKEKNPNANLPP